MANPEPTTIAFDVMGSDHGPAEVVRGAAQLSLEAPHIHALLVGDRAAIDAALAETRHNGERISRPPRARVRRHGREAGRGAGAQAATPRSLVAARLVADGEADALVSAGNTGAGVLACARHFKLIPGVRRAALAASTRRADLARREGGSVLPHPRRGRHGGRDRRRPGRLRGDGLGLRAHHLARTRVPSVALLSNGTEAQKGPPRVVEAHAQLVGHARASTSSATSRAWTSPRAPPT